MKRTKLVTKLVLGLLFGSVATSAALVGAQPAFAACMTAGTLPVLTASSSTAGAVNLSWTDTTTATSYGYKAATTSAGVTAAAISNFGVATKSKTGITVLSDGVTTMTLGTTYYFSVVGLSSTTTTSCTNTPGTAPVSAVQSVTPTITLAAPTGVTMSSGGSTSSPSVTVGWTASSNAAASQSYSVQLYSNSALTTTVGSAVSTTNLSTTFSTGLTAGTTYYATVTASASTGYLASPAGNNTTGAVALTTLTTPAAPTVAAGSATSTPSIVVTVPTISNASSYTINVCTNSALSTGCIAALTGQSAGAVTISSGLTAGTTYYAGVTAVGNGTAYQTSASSPGSAAVVATALLGAPTAVTVTSAGATTANPTVTVNWTASSNAATSQTYTVKIYSDSGLTTLVTSFTTAANATSYTYTNAALTAGNLYYATVTATASTGYLASPASTTANGYAKTALATPTAPTVASSTTTAGSIIVTIAAVTNASSYSALVCTSSNLTTGCLPVITGLVSGANTLTTANGLVAGTNYYIGITAIGNATTWADSAAGTASTIIRATTALAAPTAVTVTSGTATANPSIVISWTASSNAAASQNYTAKVYSDSGLTTLVATLSVTNAVTTTYTNALLTAGSTYYVVVSADSSTGYLQSADSTSGSGVAKQTLTAPSAPTVAAGSATATASIVITVPTVANASSYTVTICTNVNLVNGCITALTGQAAGSLTVSSGLTAGTTYYVGITAVGNSTAYLSAAISAASTGVIATAVLNAPSAVAITNTGATAANPTVTVTWTAPSNAAGSQSYTVRIYSDSGLTTLVTSFTTAANAASYTYTNAALTAGNIYYATVTANASTGYVASAASSAANGYAKTLLATPVAPTVASSTSTAGSITVTITAVTNATSYSALVCTNSSLTAGCLTLITGLTSGANTLTSANGLANGVNYYVGITANVTSNTWLDSAAGPASTVVRSTSQITAPSAPTAASGGASTASIVVTWTSATGGSGAGTQLYTINVYSDAAKTNLVYTVPTNQLIAASPFTISTGLTLGTTYYVAVTAVASTGYLASSESNASAGVVAKITLSLPTSVTVRPGGATGSPSITVKWIAPANAPSGQTYSVTIYTNTSGCTTAVTSGTTTAIAKNYLIRSTNLTSGSTYCASVTAEANGNYVASAATSTTGVTGLAYTSLTAPALSAATPIASSAAGSLTLNWQTVTGVQSWTVRVYSDSSLQAQVGSDYTGIASATLTKTVTGLTPGSTYYMTVTAVGLGNATGTGDSAPTASAGQRVKATLTATVDNKTVVYGSAAPSFTVSYSGFVLGETSAAGLTGLTCTSTYTQSSAATGSVGVKTGAITCTTPTATDYIITAPTAGNLTVTAATITVTADSKSVAYGSSTPTLTFTLSGLVNGDTTATVAGWVDPTCATTYASTTTVAAGASISCSAAAASNYIFNYVSASVTVTRAVVTVTANPYSITYASAVPANSAYSANVSGLKNSETSAVFTSAIVCTSSYSQTTNVSDPAPTITCSGAAADNYSFSYTASTVTVSKATLTASLSATSTYGSTTTNNSFVLTGFLNGQNEATFAGFVAPVCSFTSLAVNTAAGSYPTFAVNCTDGSSTNYSWTNPSTADLTIAKAVITVKVNNSNKTYGTNDPASWACSLTSGALASTDSLDASCVATRQPGQSVGTYTITATAISFAVGSAANYDVTLLPGTLTIDRAVLTITATSPSVTYGDAISSYSGTATGFAYSEDATVISGLVCSSAYSAGDAVSLSGQISVTCSGASSSNYSFAYVAGVVTITKRQVSVSAGSFNRVYGDSKPTLVFTVGGAGLFSTDSLSANIACSTAYATGSNVGDYAVVCSQSVAPANYEITAFVDANIHVRARNITVSAPSSSIIYGDAVTALQPTIGGEGVYSTDSVASAFNCSVSYNQGDNFGDYAVTCAQNSSLTNYAVTTIFAGNLHVAKRTIFIDANDYSISYLDAISSSVINSGYTISGDGLYGSDAITGNPTCSTSYVAGDAVGTYSVVCTDPTISNSNYIVAPGATGTITVGVRAITINVNAPTIHYGDAALASYSYSLTGYVDGSWQTDGAPVCVVSGYTAGVSLAASYTISCTYSAMPGVSVVVHNNALVVQKRSITVAADTLTIHYGDAVSGATYVLTLGDLVSGDASLVSAAVSCAAVGYVAGADAGTYAISCSANDLSGRYSISVDNSLTNQLTVLRRVVTVRAQNVSKSYGQTPSYSLLASYDGLYGADQLPNTISCDTSVAGGFASNHSVGSYSVICDGPASTTNYIFDYTDPVKAPLGVLTITKANLTIRAQAKNKAYGATSGALTYTVEGLQFTDTVAEVSGTLSRESGDTVGTYLIGAGSIAVSSNYSFNFIGANFTVTPAPLYVIAVDASKIYGGQDPGSFDFTSSGYISGEDASVLSGHLTRAAGQSHGTYEIGLGTLAASNYEIFFTPATFTINRATLLVSATDKSKNYGAANPAFDFTYSGLVNGDTEAVFSGALQAPTNVHVGNHAILLGSLSAGDNYSISFTSGTFTIAPVSLTVTAVAKSKVYGQVDPALTFVASGLVNGDSVSVVTGSLVRVVGEHVGSRQIQLGSVAASDYTITFVPAVLSITAASLTVTADAKTKVYGEVDPSLTFAVTGLVNGDSSSVVTGSLSRSGSEHVGDHSINQGSVVASDYTITFVPAVLSVTPASLTVTAVAKSKVYGQVDPALTFVASGLVNGDSVSVVTGSLVRVVGEHVGSRQIQLGSVAASDYTITFVPAVLSITAASLTVTADAKSRGYGSTDPALTFTATGLTNGDTASDLGVTLHREPGESVGSYAITLAAVTNGDYQVSFVGASFVIHRAVLNLVVTDASKVYGEADPSLAFTATGFVNGDNASVIQGALVREAGEHVGTYLITAGTVTAGDYDINIVSATFTITKASLTITVEAKSKTYAGQDPTLTYSASGFVNGDTSSVLSGDISRISGSHVGSYAIGLGTLTSSDYTLVLVAANLTITPATLYVSAHSSSKTYGNADPVLEYTANGFLNGDSASVLTGALVREAGSHVGTYAIALGTLAAADYSISFVGADFSINARPISVKVANASKTYGQVDPAMNVCSISAGSLADNDSIVGTCTTTRSPGNNAGQYTITASGVDFSSGLSSDYEVTFVAGVLSISKATLTITVANATKTYGTSDPQNAFEISGLVNSDDASVVSGTYSRQAGNHVGSYNYLVGTISVGSNYELVFDGGALSVTKAPLNVVASGGSKTYGQNDASFAYVVTGLVNGDSETVVTGNLERVNGEHVGAYDIVLGSLQASDYDIAFTGAKYSIAKATLHLIADSAAKTYGQSDPSFAFTVTGYKFADNASVISGVAGRADGEHVGSYLLNIGTLSASDYVIDFTPSYLAIEKAHLSVIAQAKTKVYGQVDPALTFVTSGWQLGDTEALLSGNLARATGQHVGSYGINVGSLAAADYVIDFTGAQLAIEKADLVVVAHAKIKQYGTTDSALTFTATGFVYSDSAASLVGALSRVSGEHVGGYSIELGSLSSGDYNIAFTPSVLTITPATLTVVAHSKSKVYGSNDPAFTFDAAGFAFNETASVLSGALGRAAGNSVGTYAINQGSLAGSDYVIDFTGGSLNITKATLSVTAANKTKVYGDAEPTLTFVASGWVNGDDSSLLTGALARVGSEHVGVYAINLGDLTAGGNYALQINAANLSITKATLNVVANHVSKTYGSSDPALTYTVTGWALNDSSSLLTGAITRASGENVGDRAIALGSLSAGSDYSLSLVPSSLTIVPATLTVSAAAKSKTYGASDPALTFAASGFVNGDTLAVLSGSLVRAQGSGVGSYAINQGTLSAGNNYTISYTPADLTISPATLTVTATALSKIYGATDPVLAYSFAGLTNGDSAAVFSGALARQSGESVATYAENIGSLAAGPNYVVSFIGADFTISKATLSITAAPRSKTYGTTDPALTYGVSGLANGDGLGVLSGNLTRTSGSNVGSYSIALGTLSAGSNYNISFVGANFTITKANLDVYADTLAKVYGETDPALTLNTVGLTNGDTAAVLSGSLARSQGENAGAYAINQGTVTAGANYNIVFHGANLTITKAELTVVADAQTKTYGSSDPAFTFVVTGLQFSDNNSVFTGSLGRASGANVGDYALNLGTLNAGSNYTIRFISSNLHVQRTNITVSANPKGKVYGSNDPALTFDVVGLVNGDSLAVFSGSLMRAVGENAADYAISQGSLSAGANYAIAFAPSTLTISKAVLTVTALAQSKVYGTTDPTLSFDVSGFVASDSRAVLSGSLSRANNQNVGDYPISLGSLVAGGNYTINFVSANFSITKAVLVVTADGKQKVYGAVEPALTYSAVGFVNGDNLGLVSGYLTRQPGQNVGDYFITAGALTAGPNYAINFVPAYFSITRAVVVVTADAKTKTYGSNDPVFSFAATGFANGDTEQVISGALTRFAGENVGDYSLRLGTLTAGSNYSISFVPASLHISKALLTVTAESKSKVYGNLDPALTFTTSGLVNSDNISVVSGSPVREVGSNVGSYAILVGAITAGANYDVNFVSQRLAITPATITVYADAIGKIYGQADPDLSYAVNGYVNSDNSSIFSGSLLRAAGSNVGSYAISKGTLSAGANYNINFVPASFTIAKANLTVSADSQTKAYGSADPTLTFAVSGLTNGDNASVLSGSLSRASGQSLGSYAINQGSLVANQNYDLVFVGANLTISKASLTVTSSNASVTQGTTAHYGYSVSGLLSGDTANVVSGVVCTSAYDANSSTELDTGMSISCSGGSAANYDISFVNSGNLTIIGPTTPVKTELPVGSSTATVGGQTVTVTPSTDSATGTVILSGDGWSTSVGAVDASGAPVQLVNNNLVLGATTNVTLSGSGYAPNTYVTVFIMSNPVQLGQVLTDAFGNFFLQVSVPKTLMSGTHTIQMNGLDAANQVLSTSLGVKVVMPKTPSPKPTPSPSGAGKLSVDVHFQFKSVAFDAAALKALKTVTAKLKGAKTVVINMSIYLPSKPAKAIDKTFADRRSSTLAKTLRKLNIKGMVIKWVYAYGAAANQQRLIHMNISYK